MTIKNIVVFGSDCILYQQINHVLQPPPIHKPLCLAPRLRMDEKRRKFRWWPLRVCNKSIVGEVVGHYIVEGSEAKGDAIAGGLVEI